jgi:hypothetical protein
VHFALFFVQISLNFSPSYSTFIPHHNRHLYLTKISKFLYNVLINKKIAYSMNVKVSALASLQSDKGMIMCYLASGVVY